MLKRFDFKLDKRYVNTMFAPIRSKTDVIKLLMATIKMIFIYNSNYISDDKTEGEVKLIISKMSRLLYFSKDKYFSINFPFSVDENSGRLNFYLNGIYIDNMIISQIIELISLDNFSNLNCIYEFSEHIISVKNDCFWEIIRNLFLFEDGYIRYDYDIKNSNGKIHPIYHFDIFYSSNTTFKVGLKQNIPYEHLIDLLDLQTDCHFIDKI